MKMSARNFTQIKYTNGYCEQFGRNKTLRARLMAQDESIAIPDFVVPIIKWLGS
jgi:hypothetical protein